MSLPAAASNATHALAGKQLASVRTPPCQNPPALQHFGLHCIPSDPNTPILRQ